ncbi:hypothetical protein [Photobacterium aquae]|uniref:hypothetical protein n=1 Tax=Photobacterium aquae TaxID=1195763 RepID=UPI0012ED7024|nr:hypothetical protein [Photobacterium aquae]
MEASRIGKPIPTMIVETTLAEKTSLNAFLKSKDDIFDKNSVSENNIHTCPVMNTLKLINNRMGEPPLAYANDGKRSRNNKITLYIFIM